MAWTNFANAEFEDGDILTESSVVTYIGDNLMSMSHYLDLETAIRDVVSSTSELSIWTAASGITVPANSLGANGSIRVTMFGDYVFNNNAADTLALRVRFGGAIIMTLTTDFITGATSPNQYDWEWETILVNAGATNSQNSVSVAMASTGTSLQRAGIRGTSAVDTTVDQTLDLTAQWSASSASNSFRRLWGQALLARN